jgi:sugar phosphate permease
MVVGYLSDRCKPVYIIVPSLTLAAVFLFISAVTENLAVLAVTRTLMYFFAGSPLPVLQKLLAAATPQRKRGKVFGWATTFNNVGGMLATIFSGWTIFLFETRGVFIAAAILTALLIPIILKGIKILTNQPFYKAHAAQKQ